MKTETRPCGRCNGKDTMLVCCECLRELKEERNAEVKQAIIDLQLKDAEGCECLGCMLAKELLQMFAKELLQKLGLDRK